MLRVWALLGLSATVVACSGDDHPSAAGDLSRPLPECPELDTSPCDTRVATCQERLLALAGCIYGVSNTPNVPVRVVSEDQLIEELSADDETSDDEMATDEADAAHSERALVDLRLLQPGDLTDEGGTTAQIVANIDGVYQDAERGIALVDRGRTRSDANANALLLHEFTHAIQDAEFNLDAWREKHARSTDTSLALRSVSEGQATYAQFRAYLAMLGRDVERIDWERTLRSFRDDVIAPAYEDPSPLLASITTFPYAYGAASARASWSDHQAQFDQPPTTTLEAMGYGAGIAVATPAEFGEAPTPDADYRLVDSDTLGAFVFSLSLDGLGINQSSAQGLGGAWRGDQLYIYASPGGETAWLWLLELADIASADELTTLGHSRLEVTASGKRVVLIGGDARPQFLLDAGAAFLLEP